MSSKFRADVSSAQALQSAGKLPFSSVSLRNVEEGAAVEVTFQRNGRQSSALITYFSLDDYPRGALAFLSSEDENITSDLGEWAGLQDLQCGLLEILKPFASFVLQGCDTAAQCDAKSEGEEDQLEDGSESGADGSVAASVHDSDYDMAEALDEQSLVEVFTKSSRWEALERKRVEADQVRAATELLEGASTSAAGLQSSTERLAKERQLFDQEEAFRMLSNELKTIMQAQDSPISVDTVDDDVYHLIISLQKINPESPLAEDLAKLRRRYGYGQIDLDVRLKRGLHPFYPATVQILRPRFIGPVAGAVASHPMLKLKNWDPWRTLTELGLLVQCFLERVARVDLESPFCNAVIHTQAYLPAEVNLAKLEALSDIEPACVAQESAVYSARDIGVDAARMEALEPKSKRAKTPQSGSSVWASGTGYGSSCHINKAVWDPKQSEAAQAAADAEMEAIILELIQSLEPAIASRVEHQNSGSAEPIEVTATLATVEASCLIPYLRRQLAHSSFADMCRRTAFYASVVTLVGVLCSPSLAHLIVRNIPSEGSLPPLVEVLEQVNDGAKQFERVAANADEDKPAAATTSTKGIALKNVLEERERCQQFAKLVGEVLEKAKGLVPDLPSTSSGARASSKRTRASTSNASSVPADSADVQYIQELASLKVDHSTGIVDKHHFAGSAKAEGSKPVARAVRLAKEISGLKRDLPLNAQSSIFVRFDEQNFSLWKALIVGPEGTPYEGGLFEFDFYFPPMYPDAVPQVQLCTTGGGTVRFNPNLYDNGKVCLSLLGTWSGGKGENWDPSTSTALQVLVSIQSLILVDMPWYNEPGYESRIDTKAQAMEYNLNIRNKTLRWAVCGQLKHPPAGFEEVVKKHFRLRGDKLLATYQGWASEEEAGVLKHPDGTDVKVRTTQSREGLERHIANFKKMLKDL